MKTEYISPAYHPGIVCNLCEKALHDIDSSGVRFKCTLCADYDVCRPCFDEMTVHVHDCHTTPSEDFVFSFIQIRKSTARGVVEMIRNLDKANKDNGHVLAWREQHQGT